MGSERVPLEHSRQLFPTGDDLTRIQGLGPVIERQLHDAGIVTYAQLAELNPEQIVHLIRNLPLLSVERIAQQDWPGQARALAAASKSSAPVEVLEPRSRYATFTIELLLDAAGHVYRTQVLDHQDGAAANWDGWDEDELLHFLTAQGAHNAAPDILQAAPQTAPGSTGAAGQFAFMNGTNSPAEDMPVKRAVDRAAGGARLELQFGRVDEAPTSRQGTAAPAVPYVRAQLGFRFDGAGAAQVVAQAAHCVVQLVACELSSGASILLATGQSQLAANQLEYISTLLFALPEDGRYQLAGLAWVAGSRLIGSALGPVLRVVP